MIVSLIHATKDHTCSDNSFDDSHFISHFKRGINYIIVHIYKGFSFETVVDLSMDVRFKIPANFYISGQSKSGKSYLVRCMLHSLNELFDPVRPESFIVMENINMHLMI